MTAVLASAGERYWTAGGVVRILEEDPDLARDLDASVAAQLRRHVTVDVRHLPRGPLEGFEEAPPDAFAFLILDGLVARRATIGPRASIELLGTGDVLRPWQDDSAASSLPAHTMWRALSATSLAVLDNGFLQMVSRWPRISEELTRRILERCHDAATRLCIAQMPGLEDRLHALLWHLADRWGRMQRGDAILPIRLPHSLLAELVCAQRPSVSVALKRLAADGLVARCDEGWRLRRRIDDEPRLAPRMMPTPALAARAAAPPLELALGSLVSA